MFQRRLLGHIVGWTLLIAATFGGPATANIFEVRDVAVDVTAKTAAQAREVALADGGAIAFRLLLQRLTLTEDHARLPELASGDVAAYVSDFSISDEKTSAVRYLAKLHFRFKPGEVRNLLRGAALLFAETPSKPILVLPVFQAASGLVLWEDPNPWLEAWNQREPVNGLVRLALPLGDLADINALKVQQAVRGDVAALSKLAERYKAGDAVVAYARVGLDPVGSGARRIDISMTRFNVQREPETVFLAFGQEDGEEVIDLLVRGADAVANRLEDSWKRENLLVSGEAGIAPVAVPITGLRDWLNVQKRLKNVTVVLDLKTILMSLDEVRVNLHYVGTAAQLKIALGQSDLALVQEDNEWVLYPSGAAPERKQ